MRARATRWRGGSDPSTTPPRRTARDRPPSAPADRRAQTLRTLRATRGDRRPCARLREHRLRQTPCPHFHTHVTLRPPAGRWSIVSTREADARTRTGDPFITSYGEHSIAR